MAKSSTQIQEELVVLREDLKTKEGFLNEIITKKIPFYIDERDKRESYMAQKCTKSEIKKREKVSNPFYNIKVGTVAQCAAEGISHENKYWQATRDIAYWQKERDNYRNKIIPEAKTKITAKDQEFQDAIAFELQTDREVGTILAGQGHTKESANTRELQTGETDRYYFDITADEQRNKVKSEADAISNKSKAVLFAGLGIGALTLGIIIMVLVKKFKK